MKNLAIKLLLNHSVEHECSDIKSLVSQLACQSILVISHLDNKPGLSRNTTMLRYAQLLEESHFVPECSALLLEFIEQGEKHSNKNCDDIADDFFDYWEMNCDRVNTDEYIIFYTVLILSLLCFNIGWLSGKKIGIDSLHLQKSLNYFFLNKNIATYRHHFLHDDIFNEWVYSMLKEGFDKSSRYTNELYKNSIARGCSVEYSLMLVLLSILRNNKRYYRHISDVTISKLDKLSFIGSIRNECELLSRIEDTLEDVEAQFHGELDAVEYVILLTVTWFFYQLDDIGSTLN